VIYTYKNQSNRRARSFSPTNFSSATEPDLAQKILAFWSLSTSVNSNSNNGENRFVKMYEGDRYLKRLGRGRMNCSKHGNHDRYERVWFRWLTYVQGKRTARDALDNVPNYGINRWSIPRLHSMELFLPLKKKQRYDRITFSYWHQIVENNHSWVSQTKSNDRCSKSGHLLHTNTCREPKKGALREIFPLFKGTFDMKSRQNGPPTSFSSERQLCVSAFFCLRSSKKTAYVN
jgi:hypothetical protein